MATLPANDTSAELDFFRAQFLSFCSDHGHDDPDPRTAELASTFAWHTFDSGENRNG